MNSIDEEKVRRLIHRIGLEFNLKDEDVKKVISSPYKFTREVITNLDLENIKTEEELKELKTNFIYQSIGKLYVNFRMLNNINNRLREEWKKE